MNSSFISVIIPSYNEEKYIAILLTALKLQTFQNFEIILADNHSTDRTRDIAANFQVKIVDGGLPAKARNTGAKHAKYDTFVFLDSDNDLPNNFLELIISEFQERLLDIASCLVDTTKCSPAGKNMFTLWDKAKLMQENTDTPNGSGQFIMTKRSLFEEMNGFQENIRIGEDVKLLRDAVQKYNAKFGVLKSSKIIGSSRRYDKKGVTRTAVGSYLYEFAKDYQFIYSSKTFQKMSEKIYGGWGSH